jgi:hypothetical protein
MKDFIQKPGEEVAIVIYDAPLPPKYFRFTKRFIRTLFVVFPVLLSLIFVGLFAWGFIPRLKDSPTPSFPKVLSPEDTRIMELEQALKDAQESNLVLTEKLNTTPPAPGVEDPFMLGIKKPYGMQNLTAQNQVTLEQIELKQEIDKLSLKFQIISSTPETRVTGHVLVMMFSDAGVMVYPKEANTNLSSGIKYSQGESFAVSRLRPTTADFTQKATGEGVRFIIYIFNREGDLLLMKETDLFKLGPKA